MVSLTRQEEQIMLVIHHLGNKAYLVNIRATLKELTDKYLDVGTIYVPLRRLHRRGYLKETLGEPTAMRGGKAIKYYSITAKGYGVLTEAKRIQDRLWEGFAAPAAGV